MSKTDEQRIRRPARDERSSHPVLKTMAAVGAGAIVLHGARLYLKFFGPALPYGMPQPPNDPLDSEEFVRFLSITTDAGCHNNSKVEVLRNGAEFYSAELDAIRHASNNVNLLFYEFEKGEVARRFVEALTERARAGVKVKLVVDAIGSFATPDSYFDGLRAAGGRMEWYRPFGRDTWTHMDNRTHRKIVVADGKIGFIGGAGVADHWMKAGHGAPRGVTPCSGSKEAQSRDSCPFSPRIGLSVPARCCPARSSSPY